MLLLVRQRIPNGNPDGQRKHASSYPDPTLTRAAQRYYELAARQTTQKGGPPDALGEPA